MSLTLHDIKVGVFKVIQQGAPGATPGGACAYRGSNGTRCAIGWLIPDAKYSATFEQEPARIVLPKIFSELPDHVFATACQVQRAHDSASYYARGSEFVPEFISRLTDYQPFAGYTYQQFMAEYEEWKQEQAEQQA